MLEKINWQQQKQRFILPDVDKINPRIFTDTLFNEKVERDKKYDDRVELILFFVFTIGSGIALYILGTSK